MKGVAYYVPGTVGTVLVVLTGKEEREMTSGRPMNRVVALCWLAVFVFSGMSQAAEQPAKDEKPDKVLYAFETEVRNIGKADPDAATRAAKLLPLRILVDAMMDDHYPFQDEGILFYQAKVFEYIQAARPKEALPILEKILGRKNPRASDLRPGIRGAAVTWVILKTEGMTEDQKLDFKVSLLRPGLDIEAWSSVLVDEDHRIVEEKDPIVLEKARNKIVEMLANCRQEMKARDMLLAAQLSITLSGNPGLRPTEEQIQAILKNDNGYARCVMCRLLGQMGDKRALEIARWIWGKYPTAHPSQARYHVSEIINVEGSSPVLLKFLREIDAEPKCIEAVRLRGQILGYIGTSGLKAGHDDLQAYIEKYMQKPLTLEEFEPYGKDAGEAARAEYEKRALCKYFVEQWKKQE